MKLGTNIRHVSEVFKVRDQRSRSQKRSWTEAGSPSRTILFVLWLVVYFTSVVLSSALGSSTVDCPEMMSAK